MAEAGFESETTLRCQRHVLSIIICSPVVKPCLHLFREWGLAKLNLRGIHTSPPFLRHCDSIAFEQRHRFGVFPVGPSQCALCCRDKMRLLWTLYIWLSLSDPIQECLAGTFSHVCKIVPSASPGNSLVKMRFHPEPETDCGEPHRSQQIMSDKDFFLEAEKKLGFVCLPSYH